MTLPVLVPDWVAREVSAELGSDVTRVRDIRGSEGGHSGVVRRIVEFSDSTSAFVKIAIDRTQQRSLRREIEVYESLTEPFMLEKLGHVDRGESVALILENAEDMTWPPPWTDRQIEAVLELLDQLRNLFTPNWLVWRGGPAAVIAKDSGWPAISANPEPFLSLGYVSEPWLKRNLDQLLAVADLRSVRGSALVHLDVRSDNICFLGDQVKLIDWSVARLGHPTFDQHYWATTLQSETGVRRPDLLGDQAPAHFALLAGVYASVAASGQGRGAGAAESPAGLALAVLLPWTCELLQIEPPDLI